MIGAGLNYTFGPAVFGFVYTNSHYQGTQSFNLNNGSQRFDNYGTERQVRADTGSYAGHH